MNQTYIKVKGVWKYLYRAVDKQKKTIDFLLTAQRDTKFVIAQSRYSGYRDMPSANRFTADGLSSAD